MPFRAANCGSSNKLWTYLGHFPLLDVRFGPISGHCNAFDLAVPTYQRRLIEGDLARQYASAISFICAQ